MPPLLRRSQPSIHRLSVAIQRLASTGQSSQQPHYSEHFDPDSGNGSVLKWVAGLALGAGLGALYHHNTGTEIEGKGNGFSVSSVAFADCLSPPAPEASPASDGPFSEKKATRFLFGDEFRRKVFFNYEKRMRSCGAPEKVYQYFSSFKNTDGELYMTPADLMRAVVPVFPASESNLIRDGYLSGEKSPGHFCCEPSEFFMLFDVDSDGLISFKEYIFFVTLLSIPESSFSVAFKMFDLDGNGEIDSVEFKKVMALMRAANRQGSAQRDGLRSSVRVGASVENGGLVEYFFGKDGTGKLNHDKFVQFLRDLQNEILRLEFAHYDCKKRGTISARDFALSMVASADMDHVNKLLDRAVEIDSDPILKNIRVSEDEFRNFAALRKKLEPLSWALFSFGQINGLLTKEDFQRAASQVCDIHLTNNVVDIIFHVFDENQDGNLSTDEFIKVLERRQKDITGNLGEQGIFSWFSCCWNCTKRRSSVPRFPN